MTQRNIPNSIKILCNIHIYDLQVLIKPVCIHIEEKIVFQIPQEFIQSNIKNFKAKGKYDDVIKISRDFSKKKLVSFLHLAMDYSHAKFQVYRVCKKGIKEGGPNQPPLGFLQLQIP